MFAEFGRADCFIPKVSRYWSCSFKLVLNFSRAFRRFIRIVFKLLTNSILMKLKIILNGKQSDMNQEVPKLDFLAIGKFLFTNVSPSARLPRLIFMGHPNLGWCHAVRGCQIK